VLVDLGLERRRRVIVGCLKLHRFEAGRGGRAETLKQRPVREQISEVGGETRHVIVSLSVMRPNVISALPNARSMSWPR
jgi:hypothetical protein